LIRGRRKRRGCRSKPQKGQEVGDAIGIVSGVVSDCVADLIVGGLESRVSTRREEPRWEDNVVVESLLIRVENNHWWEACCALQPLALVAA
jgi:hypothetical protein